MWQNVPISTLRMAIGISDLPTHSSNGREASAANARVPGKPPLNDTLFSSPSPLMLPYNRTRALVLISKAVSSKSVLHHHAFAWCYNGALQVPGSLLQDRVFTRPGQNSLHSSISQHIPTAAQSASGACQNRRDPLQSLQTHRGESCTETTMG